MAFLKNLHVDKVSFVRRAANRRKFLLLKTADAEFIEEGENSEMKKDLLQRAIALFKEHTTVDKTLELLKVDVLKPTEVELTEIKEVLAALPAPAPKAVADPAPTNSPANPPTPTSTPTPTNPPTPTSTGVVVTREEFDAMRNENKLLRESIEKSQAAILKSDTIEWLKRECPFVSGSLEDLADRIIKLEKVDAELAKLFKNDLKTSSKTSERSPIFAEIGTSSTSTTVAGNFPHGGDYAQAITKALHELKKSGTSAKPSEIVEEVIRSLGGERFERYRIEQINRSRNMPIPTYS